MDTVTPIDSNRQGANAGETEPILIRELNILIAEELKECNHQHWPHVCQLQSTPGGKARLEKMILHYVATEGMHIGAALALIEQELTHQE